MPDELKDTIQAMQCREEYKPEPIEPEKLINILEHIQLTPSVANLQPWEIVVISNPEMRTKLTRTLLDPMLRDDDESRLEWPAKAPVILVICMDLRRAKVRFGERGTDFALMDIGAAVMNLQLGAWNHGIKSCCIREFDPDKVSTTLELPKNVVPVLLVTLGYSNQDKAPAPTLDLADFIHRETYSGEW